MMEISELMEIGPLFFVSARLLVITSDQEQMVRNTMAQYGLVAMVAAVGWFLSNHRKLVRDQVTHQWKFEQRHLLVDIEMRKWDWTVGKCGRMRWTYHGRLHTACSTNHVMLLSKEEITETLNTLPHLSPLVCLAAADWKKKERKRSSAVSITHA